MTRCICFQPDRLSCRIEKVSAKDGEMDGRNTNRPVRYHGRIGFTSHERELLLEERRIELLGHPLPYSRLASTRRADERNHVRLWNLRLGCLKLPSRGQFSCPGFGPRYHPTAQYFGQL